MAEVDLKALTVFLDLYVDHIWAAVDRRNDGDVPIDLHQATVPSVLAGLLARQATLACRLAQSPPLWDQHTAPLLLRPMVECLATFRWIILDPVKRSGEFVGYGLGQAKLKLSKMQDELAKRGDSASTNLKAAAELHEAWIVSQRLMQFVDVNLGSWTGSSIREVCKEIGDEELYNWWYVPFSTCVHSTWEHLSQWNTKVCRNPLHNEHRVSVVRQPNANLEYVHQSAMFLSSLIDAFDEYYCLPEESGGVLKFFEDGLDSL